VTLKQNQIAKVRIWGEKYLYLIPLKPLVSKRKVFRSVDKWTNVTDNDKQVTGTSYHKQGIFRNSHFLK
jgi:hypothetical protein